MKFLSKLLGGGKDTSFSFDSSGYDKSIDKFKEFTAPPAGLQANTPYGMSALDKQTAMDRQSVGDGRAANPNDLYGNLSRENKASEDRLDKFSLMKSEKAANDLAAQSNFAYDVETQKMGDALLGRDSARAGVSMGNQMADRMARAGQANAAQSALGVGLMGLMSKKTPTKG